MTSTATKSTTAANDALADIVRHISVSMPVLKEARKRRRSVLSFALRHPAALENSAYGSGSVAHGTQNSPLEDADGGVKIDRRNSEVRAFGPGGEGPIRFIDEIAEFVLPLIRREYPKATLDMSGNRAIKVKFNQTVEVEEGVEIDPFVDMILGLSREEGGLWVPNKALNSWDLGDPQWHTYRMTKVDPKGLRVLRAHVLRLAKRAVKGDENPVIHSWNLSALALESITEVTALADALENFLSYASDQIAVSLTEDPSPRLSDPLKLPDRVTLEIASSRLAEMRDVVMEANQQESKVGARKALARLFEADIKGILENEDRTLRRGLKTSNPAAIATALAVPAAPLPVRSDGD